MPDSKITALTSISTSTDPANDPLVIVDVSDTSMAATGTTKKVTLNQLLGASGTATLASATITGDLTVDTSTLKVDSANNRVGIGTASPAAELDVVGGANFSDGTTTLRAVSAGNVAYLGTTTTDPLVLRVNNIEQYRIAQLGVFNWSDGAGGTRMTLNATGLGVGTSPTNKLDVSSSDAAVTLRVNTQNAGASASNYSQIQLSDVGTVRSYWRNVRDGAGTTQFAYNSYLQFLSDAAGTPTERMRIDSSGNVGIGVTPSAWGSGNKALESGVSGGKTGALMFGGDGSSWLINNAIIAASTTYKATAAASYYYQNGGQHIWSNAPSGTAGNAITFTQAMTLDASGNLSVGTTSAGSVFGSVRSGFVATGANGAIGAKVDATGRACLIAWNADTSGDNSFIQFFTEASITSRGSISYNRAGGLVAYNTTSDYRAKDIIGPVSNSGSLIDSLKVYVGKMKGATIERPMLIAHEAQEVAPYAVTGTKDEVDADGKPKYQQMDASALVPLLIAEIQSLRARVQTLETR